jgi:hypothetical protein
LTRNIGFDGTGTNSGKGSAIFDTACLKQEINCFTDRIELNIIAEQALCQYFNELWASLEVKDTPPNLISRVKGKISKLGQYTKTKLLLK